MLTIYGVASGDFICGVILQRKEDEGKFCFSSSLNIINNAYLLFLKDIENNLLVNITRDYIMNMINQICIELHGRFALKLLNSSIDEVHSILSFYLDYFILMIIYSFAGPSSSSSRRKPASKKAKSMRLA